MYVHVGAGDNCQESILSYDVGCAYVYAHTYVHVEAGDNCQSLFSPLMWVLGLKLRLSGLVERTFTC